MAIIKDKHYSTQRIVYRQKKSWVLPTRTYLFYLSKNYVRIGFALMLQVYQRQNHPGPYRLRAQSNRLGLLG